MISAVIIGGGNVANHLIKAFTRADGIHLKQIHARNKHSLNLLETEIEVIDDLSALAEADVYIIAISDDAISGFSAQLKLKNKLVVHTSGSVAMEALQTSANKGVFYPLQTFSKAKPVNFREIPICLEAENENDYKILENLAISISDKVYSIDSNQRKYIHLAAVFVNNFVNYMYKIGNDICLQNNIPFDILHPLIKETAEKITDADPVTVQTGPARRNDKKTIANHIELLTGREKEIYNLLTQSIQNSYGKKL